MLSARFHKMEILSAPARRNLCKICRIFPARPHNFPAFPAACIFSKKWKSFSVKFYLTTKFAAVPAATKNGNFWKNGSDIVKFAAVPKVTSIGKFWKRAQKKKEEISSSFHFTHLPSSNSASIFSFFIFLAFAFSFLIWASLAIFFSLAILAFSAFSC